MSGKEQIRPPTSISRLGQPGVAVIASSVSASISQVSSTLEPVTEGFQANACGDWTTSSDAGLAIQSRS